MNANIQRVIDLSDGVRSSIQIAEIVGLSPRYVRKIAKRLDLPRLTEGAQPGRRNHQFVAGRRIGTDGYVLVTAPANHPTARKRPNRKNWLIPEHRLAMEEKLGRPLQGREVVDHIDGLTLHNDPENLRLFSSNGDHLKETLRGRCPAISAAGRLSIAARQVADYPRVDTYNERRKRGEIRLRQILLAALSLGTDSPYLSGAHHHMAKAGIDWSERSSLERALADLYRRWGWDHAQS